MNSRLQTIDLTIRFVTPAFIGAADNREQAEFRIASLKGALRFWWRAFCAPSVRDTEGVFHAESAIFGNTSVRSAFRVQTRAPLSKYIVRGKKEAFNVELEGVRYLFYSAYRLGNSPNRKTGRENWLDPGLDVPLRIVFPTRYTDKVSEVLKALWLLENFGGIGLRSRRGAGSFVLTEVHSPEGLRSDSVPKFLCQLNEEDRPTKSKELKGFLYKGIKQIRGSFDQDMPDGESPLYTAYSKAGSDWLVRMQFDEDGERKFFETGGDAADWVGRKLRDFRTSFNENGIPERFRGEACAVHEFADEGTYPVNEAGAKSPDPLTKTAFGLPIGYRFRTGQRGSANADWGKKKGRRASPLFIRIGKLAEERFYVTVLYMWSQFLPAQEAVILSSHGRKPQELRQPDGSAVQAFMDELRKEK